MQRQSLGSPGSKLRAVHGAAALGIGFKDEDDEKSRSPSNPSSPPGLTAGDVEERKPEMPLRSHSPTSHKFVHLIPVLTFVCFLVLYLCSHDPSPALPDLVDFSGIERGAKDLGSSGSRTGEFGVGRFLGTDSGRVMAIRSLRNLQEEEEAAVIGPKARRPHRKLGDF